MNIFIKRQATRERKSCAFILARGRAFVILCVLACMLASHALAISVTGATGGGAISADTAANAASPAWTSLGPITIGEGGMGEFAAGTNVTLVLKAPAGF